MSTWALRFVAQAIEEYSAELREGNRVRLDPPRGTDRPEALHASRLAECPLKTAYTRRQVAPDFDLPEPWLLFESGLRMAEIVQEAIAWKASKSRLIGFGIEWNLVGRGYTGRADALLTEKVGKYRYYVVEIKWSASTEFRPSWAWQVIAYLEAAKAHGGVLCWITSKAELQLFTVDRHLGGFCVRDVLGADLPHDWNTPDILNAGGLDDLVHQHEFYYALAEAPFGIEPPFAEPLECWECFKRVWDERGYPITPYRYSPNGSGSKDGLYQPGEIRPGLVTARCPWAGRCWNVTSEVIETTLDEEDKEVLVR